MRSVQKTRCGIEEDHPNLCIYYIYRSCVRRRHDLLRILFGYCFAVYLVYFSAVTRVIFMKSRERRDLFSPRDAISAYISLSEIINNLALALYIHRYQSSRTGIDP